MARGFVVAALLAAACTASQAACDTGLAERMHAKLHPDRVLDHERAVCQPWRGQAGRFVVVLPLPRAAASPGATAFDLDVLLVQQADNGNTERARIVSRSFEPAALSEDAIRIAQIKVDTARYPLGGDIRAFGLRVVRQGSSRATPFSSETLTLYVPQGPTLGKVLDRLELTREHGDWDTACTGSFETVRGSLSVSRAASNGHADLLLRQVRVQTRSTERDEACTTQELPATIKTTLLRYDGALYRPARASATD